MLTPIPFPVRKWKPAPIVVSPQGSPQRFLESPSVSRTRCLILDTCLLECQDRSCSEHQLREVRIPIVFIGAQTDEHLHASLRAEGAIACRPKPFDERTQLQAWVPRCESLDPA